MLRRKSLPENKQGRWTGGKLIYTTHMGHDEPDYDANNPIIRGGQPVAEASYLTDAFTREAVDFIDRHQDKPFFLYVAYNAVHSPLQGADAYMKKFAGIDDIHRRIFAAMLGNLDDSVGAILDKLKEVDLQQETLVIFLSDNGGPTRELTSSNLPLRGEKGQMYEGGLRVPFMLHWPGTIRGGRVYQQPISSMDILPTAASLAGGKIPKQVDGVNLLPFLQLGKESEESGDSNGNDDSAIPRRPHNEFFWRQGQRTALRQGDWKIVRHKTKQAWELYNLSKDISEEKDLAASEKATVQQLSAKWHKLNEEMMDARF